MAGNVSKANEVEIETDALRAWRMRRSGRFLKGPLPWDLIAAAANLPGRALEVWLVVCHQTASTGQRWANLPVGLLGELRIDRNAKARALQQLKHAGLVQVEQTHGQPARVSLARATAEPSGDE
jgi:hypothetical protein